MEIQVQNKFQISQMHSIKYVVSTLLFSLTESIRREKGHDHVSQGTNARTLTENNMEDKEDTVNCMAVIMLVSTADYYYCTEIILSQQVNNLMNQKIFINAQENCEEGRGNTSGMSVLEGDACLC